MMIFSVVAMLFTPAVTSYVILFYFAFTSWLASIVMIFILTNRVTVLIIWGLIGFALFALAIFVLLTTILVPYGSTNSAFGGIVWATLPVFLVVVVSLLLWQDIKLMTKWYIFSICLIGYPAFYWFFIDSHGVDLYSFFWGANFNPYEAISTTFATYITIALLIVFHDHKREKSIRGEL